MRHSGYGVGGFSAQRPDGKLPFALVNQIQLKNSPFWSSLRLQRIPILPPAPITDTTGFIVVST